MVPAILFFLVLTLTGAVPAGSATAAWTFLVVMLGPLVPLIIQVRYEQDKKPILYDESVATVGDGISNRSSEPDIDQIMGGYESADVFRRIKLRARLIHLFGLLSAWDITALDSALALTSITGFYLALPLIGSYAPLTDSIIYRAMGILSLFLILLSVYGNWKGGGGYLRALQRKHIYQRLTVANGISDVITQDKLLETYYLGSYGKNVRDASDEDLIVRLYIASIPRR
jgi:hypothetical protein